MSVVAPGYRRDEPVAASGDRLDAVALGLPAVESAAQRRDLDRQIAVLDDPAGPNGGDEFFP
jgi:hypothetical protein